MDNQSVHRKESKHISAFTWVHHLIFLFDLLCLYNLNTFCAVPTEEVERLEQELELRAEEIAQLQRERTTALEELERQETVNQNLRQQHKEQQQSREELRSELDTKSELVSDGVFTVIYPSVIDPFVLAHNCHITSKQYFNFRASPPKEISLVKVQRNIMIFTRTGQFVDIRIFCLHNMTSGKKVTITIRFYKGCF